MEDNMQKLEKYNNGLELKLKNELQKKNFKVF